MEVPLTDSGGPKELPRKRCSRLSIDPRGVEHGSRPTGPLVAPSMVRSPGGAVVEWRGRPFVAGLHFRKEAERSH